MKIFSQNTVQIFRNWSGLRVQKDGRFFENFRPFFRILFIGFIYGLTLICDSLTYFDYFEVLSFDWNVGVQSNFEVSFLVVYFSSSQFVVVFHSIYQISYKSWYQILLIIKGFRRPTRCVSKYQFVRGKALRFVICVIVADHCAWKHKKWMFVGIFVCNDSHYLFKGGMEYLYWTVGLRVVHTGKVYFCW